MREATAEHLQSATQLLDKTSRDDCGSFEEEGSMPVLEDSTADAAQEPAHGPGKRLLDSFPIFKQVLQGTEDAQPCPLTCMFGTLSPSKLSAEDVQGYLNHACTRSPAMQFAIGNSNEA